MGRVLGSTHLAEAAASDLEGAVGRQVGTTTIGSSRVAIYLAALHIKGTVIQIQATAINSSVGIDLNRARNGRCTIVEVDAASVGGCRVAIHLTARHRKVTCGQISAGTIVGLVGVHLGRTRHGKVAASQIKATAVVGAVVGNIAVNGTARHGDRARVEVDTTAIGTGIVFVNLTSCNSYSTLRDVNTATSSLRRGIIVNLSTPHLEGRCPATLAIAHINTSTNARSSRITRIEVTIGRIIVDFATFNDKVHVGSQIDSATGACYVIMDFAAFINIRRGIIGDRATDVKAATAVVCIVSRTVMMDVTST